MQFKLSIGSAVYNIEPEFLRAHIENILAQLTQETELLLIDDCSTNESGDICREYAAKDARVRYINMGTNSGLSSVRNRTVEEAAGKWIFFADADDLLSDYFISTALRFCDTDFDIIIHERLKFAREPEKQPPCAEQDLRQLPPEAGRSLSISCLCLDPNLSTPFGLPGRAFYHAAWGALYRKDFLVQNNILFPVGQKKAQDAVFNTRAYYHAKKIGYLPYVMYYYRVNPQGITQRYSADLPEVYASLRGHLEGCMREYYADDRDVEQRYINHRMMAIVIDIMRLNIFHEDNPKSVEEREADFYAFIHQEPYKTALASYDISKSGRWEWSLPLRLIRNENFKKLDRFMGDKDKYRIYCAAYKREAKLLNKLRKG